MISEPSATKALLRVDVAAPGVDILSTYRSPDDPDPAAHYIALLDGTSMAGTRPLSMSLVQVTLPEKRDFRRVEITQ